MTEHPLRGFIIARVLLAAGLLAAGLLAAGPAQAQGDGCQASPSAVPTSGPGTLYLMARMSVPHDGRCSVPVYGQANQLRIVRPPRYGRAEISNGAARYMPNPGYSGPDSFVYGGDTPRPHEVAVSIEVR